MQESRQPRANQTIEPSGLAGFSRASWGVVALALLVLGINLYLGFMPLLVAGDGWVYQTVDARSGLQSLVPLRRLLDGPSPVGPNDRVLAIEGQTVEALFTAAFAGRAPEATGWQAGERVRYTVLRDGAEVTVEVPLQRATLGQALRFFMPAGSGALLVVVQVLMVAISLFVFVRRPQEAAARLLLLFGVAMASGFLNMPQTTGALFAPPLVALYFWCNPWQFILMPVLVHLFLIFPVVRWPLRRYPRLSLALIYGLASVCIWVLWGLNLGQPVQQLAIFNGMIAVQGTAGLVIMLISIAHCFITVRDPVARAQMRWMTFGLLVGFMGSAMIWLVATVLFEFSGVWEWASMLMMLALPVGLGVAILRYRLMNIDVLINRALVYGSVTALLALAYFGSVVLLQNVFRAFTGQQRSELVTVLSTLAIAALFTPLRARLQMAIDRRFYRRKYDAARTVAAFGATLRDNVDLDTLSGRLLAVINETVRPQHASLWLRQVSEVRPQPGGTAAGGED